MLATGQAGQEKMNKKIASEIAIGIILLIAVVVGGIFWLQNNKTQAPVQQPVVAQPAPVAQNQVTQPVAQPVVADETANQSTIQPEVVTSQIKTVDYSDSKMNFKVKIPENFFEQKSSPNDGIYAYSRYFISKNNSDAGINIIISKSEKDTGNAGQLKEIEALKKNGLVVSDVKNLTVDGVSALQQMEDSMKVPDGDPGCSLETYFMKNGKSHQIELFIMGKGCDETNEFRAEYDIVVNSFQD
jgi:uncharacterized protein YkuJ